MNKVVHGYNCTLNDATEFLPFFLLLERSPRLSIELLFETSLGVAKANHTEFVDKWIDGKVP